MAAATLFRIVKAWTQLQKEEEIATRSHYNCNCSRFSFNRHSNDNSLGSAYGRLTEQKPWPLTDYMTWIDRNLGNGWCGRSEKRLGDFGSSDGSDWSLLHDNRSSSSREEMKRKSIVRE